MAEPVAGKLSLDSLTAMAVTELKSFAKGVGVAVSGNKGDIVLRLVQHGVTAQDLQIALGVQPMDTGSAVADMLASSENPAKKQKTGAEGAPQKDTAGSGNTNAAGDSVKHPAIGGGSAPAIPVASSPVIPVRPRNPLAKNSEWAEYYDKLARYVLHGLKSELKACGVDISQHGELHHVPPTDIEKNTVPAIGGAQMTTFRETWNVERCQAALKSTGKYEAAGSLWWFNLLSGGEGDVPE